jgi:hypothetical protein
MRAGPRSRRNAPFAIAAVIAALAGAASLAQAATARRTGSSGARDVPQRLADTGLYSDFASRTIAAGNIRFSPQYPLWSDGAAKRRWVSLPPGTFVDASDPERWVFPVGTKIWKEFAWSRPIETRYLERTREGWIYAAYVWTDDGRDAALAPETGVTSSHEVAPGRRHAIPSVADCWNCHRNGRAEILGFSALQLSPDRDPLAPHAEAPAPGDATLATLVQRGLVRGLPRALVAHPPRIVAPTARGRAALGYLHANCGTCHDSVGPMASLGVSLRHALAVRGARDEPATRAIGHPTSYRIPGAGADGSVWIAPGAASASALLERMASRSPITQMPPLGTKIVDDAAVALLRGWIEEDLRAAEPKQR